MAAVMQVEGDGDVGDQGGREGGTNLLLGLKKQAEDHKTLVS